MADRHDREAGLPELGRDRDGLLGRQRDGDAWSSHDQPSVSGSLAVTVSSPSASAVTRAPKPGERGDGVPKDDAGVVGDREEEFTVGSGRNADRLDTGDPGQLALEAGDARDADEARHDDAGGEAFGAGAVGVRHESRKAGGQGVVADHRRSPPRRGILGCEGGGLGLGGVEVGRQAKGVDARVARHRSRSRPCRPRRRRLLAPWSTPRPRASAGWASSARGGVGRSRARRPSRRRPRRESRATARRRPAARRGSHRPARRRRPRFGVGRGRGLAVELPPSRPRAAARAGCRPSPRSGSRPLRRSGAGRTRPSRPRRRRPDAGRARCVPRCRPRGRRSRARGEPCGG